MKALLQRIRQILKDRRTRRFFKRFVGTFAAIVVFITTYALVLPAITMESEASCGIEAHQHSDDCYEEVLVCDIPESAGHLHDETCYDVSKQLVCCLDEHQHSHGCYDENGELTCGKTEHTHSEEGGCYQEVKELVCGLEESAGHQHDSSCYEKELICGKEVHTHSAACYRFDDSGNTAEGAAVSSTNSAGVFVNSASFASTDIVSAEETSSAGSATATGNEITDDLNEGDLNEDDLNEDGLNENGLNDDGLNDDKLNDELNGELNDEVLNAEEPGADNSNTAASGGTMISGESASSGTAAASTSSAASGISANDETAASSNTSAASAASTASNVADPSAASTASTAAGFSAENTYVPALDPLDFNQILTDSTRIYYFHPEDQETAPENSGDITDWKPVEKETILDPDDILRVYLAYSIPAGSLNATNPVARYRLPSNLHLSDSQMESINSAVNGIANQYVSLDTLEITDPEKYNQFLGVEAIEGTRSPSDDIDEFFAKHTEMGGQEYISATVKVEDVYDTDDTGDTDNTDDIDAAEGGIDGNGERIDSSGEKRVAVNGERTDVNGENRTYLGTDLVFTFTPYSIQKNQHTYDSTGKPTSAGQKIQGWLTFDLRTDQIDFATVGTVDVEKSEDGETAADSETGVDKETAVDEGTTVDKETAADEGTTADKETTVDEGMTVDKEAVVDTEATADTETADDTEATADKETTEDADAAVDKGTKEEPDSESAKDDPTEPDFTEKTAEKPVTNTAVEKEATIVFVPETKDPQSGLGKDEISQTLHLHEIVTEVDAVSDDKEEKSDKTEDESAEDDKAENASLPSPAVTFQDSITTSMGTLSTDTEAGDTVELPEQTELSVYVEADEGTFPEGTTMKLSTVEDMDAVASAVEEAVTTDDAVSNKTRGFHAVDISFWNAEGKEIEPLKPIRVSIKSESIKQAVEDASTAPVVVHITDPATDSSSVDDSYVDDSNVDGLDEEKSYKDESDKDEIAEDGTDDSGEVDKESNQETAENVETGEPENENGNYESPVATIVETEKQTSTNNGEKDDSDTLTFEAGTFSVYAIVYTVDFHWEVNGKMYDFSMPGGGFVSFQQLIEVLGIVDGTYNGEDEAENEEITDAENADDEQAEAALMLNDVEVSDATREFVADVEKVEFSNPELVWAGKVDENTTVGGLKEANELDVQYSAELTEEQIEEINSTVVESGDWALISVQPFESTESLTVTMKTGEKFIIRVTDANITNATDLEIGEEYILYIIGTDGEYFALRDDGQTLWVPDRELEDLDNHYRWVYSENDEHTGAIWTCNRYRINPYVATNYWYGGWWGDATIYNPGWTPISRLVSLSDGGFKFEDLNNPDRYLAYYSHTNGNDIIRTKWDYSYNDIISIHIFKPGTSYTVQMKSNNEEYGSVKYTLANNTQSTSASVTSISAETEKSESENKLVPGTITAEPKEGYKFTGWTVQQVNAWENYQVIQWGEGKTAESSTIQPTVDGDLTLLANFEPEKIYTFTVRTDNEEMGTVGGGDSNGNNLTGQTNFETITGAVINNQGRNAYEIEAEKLPLHMFERWELRDSGDNLIQELTTPTIDANSLVLTGDNMTLTAFFREKTETEIDEDDIDTLLNSWKADMTNDFVGVDKTAHVHDYDNRIYEIDLSASSGKWAVERSITLDFITDTSRSMYFPANLEYAKETEAASTYTDLSKWLQDNDPTGESGETYYVISKYTSSDTTATMFAVYYKDAKWMFVDSSYYYNTDGEKRNSDRISQVPNKNKPLSGETGYNVLQGKELSGIIYKSSSPPVWYGTGGNGDGYKPSDRSLELTKYWSRLDYLYKAVMTASETLKTIDPQAEAHLTTFNAASENKGSLYSNGATEQEIYLNKLGPVAPSGGTRQDRGLWTARRGTNASSGDPNTTPGAGSSSAFKNDSDHQQFAILITDGAPNGTSWGGNNSGILQQARLLKEIKDSNNDPLTLMTLGLSLNFVGNDNRTGLQRASSDSTKYAKEANNGGEIVKAIKALVESMVEKASLYGTVSDKLDPAFYPVKADGTPIAANVYYDKDGNEYSSKPANTPCYQWTKNGEEWTVNYYNQTFRWPTRDGNGNITENGWEQAFYVKSKEDFLGGNTIETNGTTTFTATHTLLLDSNGEERPSTKAEIKNSSNQSAPIVKNDVPTPHINVKQLTLDGNETQWKVYIETTVDPLPQIKELYNNIQVSEVVDSSTDHMITNKAAMLFVPGTGTVPETFLLKSVTGEADNINWTTLMDGGTVDIPYMRYGHAPGVIRLALTKTGDNAAYGEHQTSSSQIDTEKYVLTAQYIPYTVDEMISSDITGATDDGAYHTTANESPGTEQREGRPSENKHTISLFVRGLSLTKTDEFFFHGLTGAEFTVYRPATAEETSSSDEEVQARLKTFAGDTATYIVDEVLTVDDSGVTFKNSVKSYSLPVTKYYLVEIKAPDGYNLREEPIPVELQIKDSYTLMPVAAGATPAVQTTKPQSGLYNWDQLASLELLAADGVKRTTGAYDPEEPNTDLTHIAITPSSEYEVMYYRISNNPGVELPATGGSGTQLFTILGSILTLGACLLLWRRRRYC